MTAATLTTSEIEVPVSPETSVDEHMTNGHTVTGEHTASGHTVTGEHTASGHTTSTGMSNTKLAMWVFLGSECLLFGGLISTYLLYKTRGNGTVLPTDVFDIEFTSMSSFILLMSSLTMVLALSAVSRGANENSRVWLLATASLGSVFVGGQIYEFTAFLREGLGFTTNPASSAFFTLTGFHGVHVSIGIIMIMSLFVASWKGKLSQQNAETVEVVGLYWHFVDIVWIFIFTVIYLIPAN